MSDNDAGRTPEVRASDADREAVMARLHTALGEGRIDVDEFGQRASAAYEAVTTAELDVLLADLPTAQRPVPEIVGARTPEVVTTTFGDIALAGTTAPHRVGTVFGDVRLDLRGLRTGAERVEVWLSTVFGDVDVIVAEGVDAELQGRTVLGDRKVDLAAVPRIEGTPLIVVRARSIFGDLRLRSLPAGVNASRWRAMLDRLSQRPPDHPPQRPA